MIRELITNLCIRILCFVNREKDNGLSYHLHGIADLYNTRPEGKWW